MKEDDIRHVLFLVSTTTALAIFGYLCLSFYSVSFDISCWSEGARFTGTMWFFASLVGGFVISDIKL